jgi:hypothetical protein
MALLGLSPEELHESLQRDFARCFVSVHPLSGDAPFAQPLIDAQIEFAKTQNKPRLVWTPNRPDELANSGFEWFTSQVEIEERIRRLFEKPAAAKPSASRLIYFLCPDRANKLRAEKMLDTVEQGGVRIFPSPLDGPADQAFQTHLRALDELDGCLIYYGDVDRDWFDSVFLKVQKKIRQSQLPSAIFLAPPPTEHKTQDLRYLGVPLLNDAEGVLRTFGGGV